MSAKDRIITYLRDVNPDVIAASPDPARLELRAVLDSVDMLDFIVFLEDAFSIDITDEEVVSRNFGTVDSSTRFIAAKSATE